ncbi:MAG: hypothetical protein QOJ27_2244 [Sphingomonadales bacterium]|nr:hypothetical protein [Sphingomonadales bacterium]
MRLVSIAAGLALLVAASASGAARSGKGETAGDPSREICKSRPTVGSRLKRVRECHSAAQWDDMKLAEQIGLGRQQYNGADGLGKSETALPPGRGQPQ